MKKMLKKLFVGGQWFVAYRYKNKSFDVLKTMPKEWAADPFLFHYTNQVVHTSNAEVLPAYPSLIYNLSIIFILAFFVWGLIKSKAVLRNICLCFFGYNIIIHFICGYGNNELQLFCGHWLFFIPLFIAIGLDSIHNLPTRRVLQMLLLTCAAFFAIHNAYCYILSIQACSI